MNQTINKIVESIESLSREEKYLLFEQLAKRKGSTGLSMLNWRELLTGNS